ncbi:hypothetical protein EVAR_66424_1 [Eumeta japonica]|uniref:Uncharacterized protein n=1 Tax=Eumeta variegata TaxID=151549 RepID=A0A4C1ZTQ6_EUMVA|nr:hypothetical protein EVAR_66424_1 [Eumeta japonica]
MANKICPCFCGLDPARSCSRNMKNTRPPRAAGAGIGSISWQKKSSEHEKKRKEYVICPHSAHDLCIRARVEWPSPARFDRIQLNFAKIAFYDTNMPAASPAWT